MYLRYRLYHTVSYKIQDIYEKEQDQFGDMNYTEPTEEDLKAIKGYV